MSLKYFAAALATEGVISGLKTRVFPSRSKNLYNSLEGVVPISLTYVGVAVFVGLIACDTQKLKNIFMTADTVDETTQKIALLGALTLYLDFINLFLFLLRILGGNRD